VFWSCASSRHRPKRFISSLKLTCSTNTSHHRSSPIHRLPSGLQRAFTDSVPLSVVLILPLSSFSWHVCRTKLAFTDSWYTAGRVWRTEIFISQLCNSNLSYHTRGTYDNNSKQTKCTASNTATETRWYVTQHSVTDHRSTNSCHMLNRLWPISFHFPTSHCLRKHSAMC